MLRKAATTLPVPPSAALPATHGTAASRWVLYLLECVDGTYYAGITTNLARRFDQHVAGKGARYTRAHRPRRIMASMAFPDRAAASRAEYALKQLKKQEKPGYFAVAGKLKAQVREKVKGKKP